MSRYQLNGHEAQAVQEAIERVRVAVVQRAQTELATVEDFLFAILLLTDVGDDVRAEAMNATHWTPTHHPKHGSGFRMKWKPGRVVSCPTCGKELATCRRGGIVTQDAGVCCGWRFPSGFGEVFAKRNDLKKY